MKIMRQIAQIIQVAPSKPPGLGFASPDAPLAHPGCVRAESGASLSGRKSPQESSLQADLPLQDLSQQPSDRLRRPAHLVKVYSYSVASVVGRLAPRPFLPMITAQSRE